MRLMNHSNPTRDALFLSGGRDRELEDDSQKVGPRASDPPGAVRTAPRSRLGHAHTPTAKAVVASGLPVLADPSGLASDHGICRRVQTAAVRALQ
jgi:hypothetical protein